MPLATVGPSSSPVQHARDCTGADVAELTARITSPRFIDLHQDMLSGVARLDGGFPVYGSSYLTGSSHAAAVWSSLYPHDPESSLLGQLEAHDELLASHSSSLRLVTTVADLTPRIARTGVLPHSEGFHLPGIEPDALDLLWAEHSLRSLALTWNYETDYGFSCYDDGAAPLKPAGRQLVSALERQPPPARPGPSQRWRLLRRARPLRAAGARDALVLPSDRGPPARPGRRAAARARRPRRARRPGVRSGLPGAGTRSTRRCATSTGSPRWPARTPSPSAATGASPRWASLADPAALVGLLDAVDSSVSVPRLAEKFAFANAYDFLCAQLPLAE